MGGTGAAHREVARFGTIVAIDMGVRQPWGIQISSGLSDVAPEDARAAIAWCARRGQEHGWRACLPASRVGRAPWDDLVRHDQIPMLAAESSVVTHHGPFGVPGLVLDEDPSYESIIAAYGGWMADEPLARSLVVREDLHRPGRRFIVGRVQRRPIGCAFVWWSSSTGYLSGIGVLPGLRGRGYGRALTAAAALLAAAGPDGATGPDLVWMHATTEGAALYSRMGFQVVDTEVQVGPRGSPT
jgi:GNAT superfamily N-acetyltransferase